MATAGSTTVDATGENVYVDTDGCTTFMVRVPATSTQAALVNIPGLHASGDFFKVAKGKDVMFRLFHMGIKSVFVKGAGGNATVEYGVVVKTYRYMS